MLRLRPRGLQLACALLLFLALPGAACAHTPCRVEPQVTPDPAAIDPRLRPLLAGEPEREVGVLLRTTRELTREDRACLEELGLVIGSVGGTIVSGRIRAGEVEKVAALPFVRYVEQAVAIPVPRPVPPDLRPERTPPPEPR